MNLSKQELQPEPEYRIPLSNGMTSLVDKDDHEYLMQWKWDAVWIPRTLSYHAGRYEDGALILMENVIMRRMLREKIKRTRRRK